MFSHWKRWEADDIQQKQWKTQLCWWSCGSHKYTESLWQRLQQAAEDIDQDMNVYKTELMCFQLERVFSTLTGKLLKLVWFGLVSLFNGISTFLGHLMPKLFFSKNSRGTI